MESGGADGDTLRMTTTRRMNSKSVYYSCATWLSFQVNRQYFGDVHYVWCTPFFDPRSPLSPHNVVPPTSSPKEIYWNLRKEVEAADRHSAKIAQNKAGIRRGADINLKLRAIDDEQHAEIMDIVGAAEIADFRPLVYVIPGNPVESTETRSGQGSGRDLFRRVHHRAFAATTLRRNRALAADQLMDILTIVGEASPKTATEALYFALRALKQAGLSSESKKDYFHDSEASLPSAASVMLAERVIRTICATEGVDDLDHIPRFRIDRYIAEVAHASDEIARTSNGFSLDRGAELLKRMRRAEAGEV